MNFVENDLKLKILRKYWGFKEFRESQEEIIENVLQKKDVLALLPTGGGKSLCYQLPAIILKGTCLVISPLIALMEDQVNQLQKKGVEATYLNSSHSFRDIDRILDNVIYGSIKILYISPERIKSKLFEERFKKMKISFVAIDEAHCISEWGNDFRPDFRTISILKQWQPNLSFIALTASATKNVIIDIQDQLLFKNKNIIRKSYLRKNIRYEIIDAINKETVLLKIIKRECSIIYAKTRKKTEQLSKLLNKNKFKSEFYHGGLNFEERIIKQK
jgi:ATP-dependent DNA helicase RecQ